jgi:glutamyl-tRNA reductase
MQLLCLSVSYRNTPVKLRECMSLYPELVEDACLRYPVRRGEFAPISEMVVLSTCNRLEVYAVVASPGAEEENEMMASIPILTYLRQAFSIPDCQIVPYIVSYTGIEAVRHLFQVTAGLDSIAMGETQILGQVSRALESALHQGSARHVLSSLFRAAIHTGKRVHSETEIGRRPTSISRIAVRLAESSLGEIGDLHILVIGAGRVGEYTLEALREQNARQVLLTNRSEGRAVELARRQGGVVLPFERLKEGLILSDVVFTSTAAPFPIIHRDLIQEVIEQRPQTPLLLIDLSVPRNVDPGIREIPNVQLFDMDDIQSFALNHIQGGNQGFAKAEQIVEAEVAEYEKLFRVIPFIGELHKKMEHIRQREVEKTLRHLNSPNPQINEQIELLSRSLVQKILHEPTRHLRTETDQEALEDYVGTLARLFDLSEPDLASSKQNGGAWQP